MINEVIEQLQDTQLIQKLKTAVQEERRLTAEILEYLNEVDIRRLYADFGCPSLWDFCIKELGYSEGAASRRIQSMRLLREVPELKNDLVEGRQSLMSLAQAQVFFRSEQKHWGQKMPIARKREVLKLLERKTARECERQLSQLSSLPKAEIQTLEIDASFLKKLSRIRELRSHAQPGASDSELLHYMADEILQRIDPLVKKEKKENQKKELLQLPPALEVKRRRNPLQRRSIPIKLRNRVWRRDKGRCTSCGSRHFLELDHIRPVARGGTNKMSNLRLRCRAHNQRAAIAMGFTMIRRPRQESSQNG